MRQGGYSTILMGGVRDPYIIAELDCWLTQLDDNIRSAASPRRSATGHYEIVTRVYGRDGVMGALEPERKAGGHEVFIVWDVITDSRRNCRARSPPACRISRCTTRSRNGTG